MRVGEAVTQLLQERTDLTAREVAWHLRSRGFDVRKRQINPLLHNDKRFAQDGGRVPRWRLEGQAARRADIDTRVAEKQNKRRSLDEQQAITAAARDSAVTQEQLELYQEFLRYREAGGTPIAPPAVQPGGSEGSSTRSAQVPAPRAAPPASDGAQRRPATPAPREPVVREPWQIANLRPWQQEALTAWFDCGAVGVCEAVTGTGKTHLGLEAVAQTIARGRRATVLVPSVLLQRQWEVKLEEFVSHALLATIGGVASGDPTRADVIIAVVNSAVTLDLLTVGPGMELLVADEVHRYGGEGWSAALRLGYERRLGLTATLERGGDDGVTERLLPYFEKVVHSYGYDRATREDVVAPFDLIFLGVDLQDEEAQLYARLSRRISQTSGELRRVANPSVPLHQQLGALRGMGGDITKAVISFESCTRNRRRLLARTPAKLEAVELLASYVDESDGTVIFTEDKQVAIEAAERLRGEGVIAEAVFGSMPARRRQRLIDDLGDGALQALAAPKILDEGVDVPDVNLGIVMGGSTSRRQMIQRLGRVIRLKLDGGMARFVVLFVNGTVEDPTRGAREDFLIEVEDAATRTVLLSEWDDEELDAAWAGDLPGWERDAR